MKIGLIDVDGHGYPNLALMKISAWHKRNGDEVEWHLGGLFHYDRVYMAKVFSSAYSPDIEEPLNADQIIKGGTGYAIDLKEGHEVFDREKHQELPEEIERAFPDYSIYPQFDFAVSMTSRGCPRGCPFCHIKDKEGRRCRKTANVTEYWNGQKEIRVLDANLTACADRYDLLDQYARTGAKIDYTQGLDLRALDDECVRILNRTNLKRVHFAWDNPQDDLTEKLKWYASKTTNKPKGKAGMVYVLTNFNSTIEEDLYRIRTLRGLNYDPYVMVYNKPNAPKEIKDLQRWCNNKIIFESCKWEDYMIGNRGIPDSGNKEAFPGRRRPMKLIDADKILEALGVFTDKKHGDQHFLNGIETAREIVEQMPVAFVVDQDIPDDICFFRETLGES